MPMKNLLRSYVVKIWPLFERFLKLYCEPERNTRSVTLVGLGSGVDWHHRGYAIEKMSDAERTQWMKL